jgi:hypothetical protein
MLLVLMQMSKQQGTLPFYGGGCPATANTGEVIEEDHQHQIKGYLEMR